MKFLSEEDAESLYSADYMRVNYPSERCDLSDKNRFDDKSARWRTDEILRAAEVMSSEGAWETDQGAAACYLSGIESA